MNFKLNSAAKPGTAIALEPAKAFGKWHGFSPAPRIASTNVAESAWVGAPSVVRFQFYVKKSYYGYRSKWYKVLKRLKRGFDSVKHIWSLVEKRVHRGTEIIASSVNRGIERAYEFAHKHLDLFVKHHAHHTHSAHGGTHALPKIEVRLPRIEIPDFP